MKHPNGIILAFLGLALGLGAQAEVFVRVDASGNTTYTNLKQGGLEEAQVTLKGQQSAGVKKLPTMVIAPQEQNVRDQKRRDILQTELNSEMALLKSEVTPASRLVHQQNIELIRKELAR